MPPGLLMCTITALAFDLRQPLERLDALAVAADQAFDVDPGDRPAGAAGERAAMAGEHDARADHGDDGDEHRHDAPERQLAPHAAAIDDEIGIERHGVISSN